MSTKLFALPALALVASGSLGCATTVRSMSATAWIAPPEGAAAAAAAPPPAAAAEGADGEAAPAGPPAATPAPAAQGLRSQYYMTYWEGSCKPILGCGRGDTFVKRCTVQADNSVVCVDEADATKALAAD